MLWGKKPRSKELPDLPPMPMSRPMAEEEENQDLPSFPDSAVEKGFSQSAIKEAVSTEELSNFPDEAPRSYREEESRSSRKSNDVYVKVDKFVSARKALEGAQTKINEMQELLKVIRETKMREEQELEYWEKEISAAKAHVEQVTENIFGKLE